MDTDIPVSRMRRALAVALLALAFPGMPAHGQQNYPARPIRFVVPFTSGTGIDILARSVGQRLSVRLGTPVVIENRAGASGNIGTEAVAKSAPDGYTLLMTASTLVTNVAVLKSVPYDPITGFVPIGLVAIGSMGLVVHPSVPARSVTELVTISKAQPGKLNYASPGNGTPHHLAMELFKLRFGIDLLHVPYKGTAGAVTDLLSGQVQAMFLPVHVALAQAQAGKLRLLTAGGAQRSAATPAIPSLAEEGVSDIDVDIWYAMLGPAGLSPEIAKKLNAEAQAILAEPDTRESLLKQGLTPRTGTPEELARLIAADLERWTALARTARISAD